uniref:Uncharacterized protein n=1 Tax=Ignisphaera aggregans TaxID=334771 RepID=A0A7J2TBS0_9CREN
MKKTPQEEKTPPRKKKYYSIKVAELAYVLINNLAARLSIRKQSVVVAGVFLVYCLLENRLDLVEKVLTSLKTKYFRTASSIEKIGESLKEVLIWGEIKE